LFVVDISAAVSPHHDFAIIFLKWYYHALRRHWRNHVSAEARATYVAGAGASKDQLEEIVADESLGLLDHYRIIRGALYKGLSAG